MIEIEKHYLVNELPDDLRTRLMTSSYLRIEQYYLEATDVFEARVRKTCEVQPDGTESGVAYVMTAKNKILSELDALARTEIEFVITESSYETLCKVSFGGISKKRYTYEYNNVLYTIDNIDSLNDLIIVEYECIVPDDTKLDELHLTNELPEWVGPEVTNDERFRQGNLIRVCNKYKESESTYKDFSGYELVTILSE